MSGCCDGITVGDTDEIGSIDSRTPNAYPVRQAIGAVLGANLGGGLSGSGLGSGIGRIGGGLTPPITHVGQIEPVTYPQVRPVWHFDFTTPALVFDHRRQDDQIRAFGGLWP